MPWFQVLKHFEYRLEQREGASLEALSVKLVLDIIDNGARRLPDDRLKVHPALYRHTRPLRLRR